MHKPAQEIIEFWRSLTFEQYFTKDIQLDNKIKETFGGLVKRGVSGELFSSWTGDNQDILALIILLDQFPRNIYRDSPQSFLGDLQAQILSRKSITEGYVAEADEELKMWYLMPLMHSEMLADQELSLTLFKQYNLNQSIPSAQEHREIIKRFGRFPHRNKILCRESTHEEIEFLKNGGFKG